MARLLNFFAILRGELWIIPALMGLSAVGLGVALLRWSFIELDSNTNGLWWIYTGDAQTALNLLSTLLGGLITIMSLVISVTFVTLILAANQLGPRLILNFIGDRAIQSVIGLFLSSILYTLIVLRSLEANDDPPHLAVTVATILAFLCIVALLFYVHKIARAIISDTVVERVGDDLHKFILCETEDLADDHESHQTVGEPEEPLQQTLSLETAGYVQTIDYEKLLALATSENAVVKVKVRAGHYILPSNPHIEVYGTAALTETAERKLRASIVVGKQRSPAQDLEFSIRQLVEVALRALSPGINDPFTAIAVLNQLGRGLASALSRSLPRVGIADEEGNLRLIANRSDAGGLVDTAFDQIRQSAASRPDVLICMAETICKLARSAGTTDALNALKNQLNRLRETTNLGKIASSDKEIVLLNVSNALDEAENRMKELGDGFEVHVSSS